jgi:glycosyltransferase involved in cell wall biosynthesis
VKDLVSIIVPIYNQEKYLDVSIPSLINQKYKNIEIVLVNDGSTDSSADIIRRYASLDSRIVVIEKENGGLVDATLAGVTIAKGTLMCFLDPDDRVGVDFVENFIEERDNDYDFVAFGFYFNDNGKHKPYFLEKNQILAEKELLELRNTYLWNHRSLILDNTVYIARWNKLYKSNTVKKIAKKFSECKDISLGEDSLMTYLMLSESKSAKILHCANSYYYNIGNQNSMTKGSDVADRLKKSKRAFWKLNEFCNAQGTSTTQSGVLLYFLCEPLIRRTTSIRAEYVKVIRELMQNKDYRNALNSVQKATISIKTKIRLCERLYIPVPTMTWMIETLLRIGKKTYAFAKREVPATAKDIFRYGFKKAFYNYGSRERRRHAYSGLKRNLPLLEERIVPILKPFKYMKTDLSLSSVERSVFVFWWDGFENAPLIVKKCLKSVKETFEGYNVIEITSSNYEFYTDIDSVIKSDVLTGKISIQTFSDILRFNILKNNGGVWIDSTIYFAEKYDICDRLHKKPIESLCFSSSKNFLQYKTAECTWSGFFMAARKGTVFVKAVDTVFQTYYKEYGTYTTYFFIDAVLMICKLQGIDGDCLCNIEENDGDMFLLSRLLDEEYSTVYESEIKAVPQKLYWFYKKNNDKTNTFYDLL